MASTQHPNGSISYLVGAQGGQFYPASLGVEGVHAFPGLDLTITNQARWEVVALREMGDFARHPATQAAMQVPGFISMTALEVVAPRAYDQIQQIGAQAGQMWTDYVGRMVAEGRMSPRTGNDLAVGLPTAVAVTTAAMGAPRWANEAGVGARMMTRSMPRVSVDIDVRALSTQTNAIIGPLPVRARVLPSAASNGAFAQSLASRADAAVAGRAGTPSQIGTWKHTYARDLLRRYNRRYGDPRGLEAEVRYVNGAPWNPGDPLSGSVVLDVVDIGGGSRARPVAVYDYKYGVTQMGAPRIAEIRGAAGFGNVPIYEVRP